MSSPNNNPDEHLFDDAPDNRMVIKLSRDSLILFSAVLFLGVAMLLALIFGRPAAIPDGSTTPGARTPSPSRSTSTPATAGRPTDIVFTAVPGSTSAVPPGATPTMAEPVEPTPPTAIAVAPTVGPGGYPAPGGQPTAALPASPTPSSPAFLPTLTTMTPGNLPLPTAANPGNQFPTLAQPTVALPPTVVQPTIAPPPTSAPQPTIAPPPTAAISPTPRPPSATPRPTAIPVTILRGTNYFRLSDSPHTISRDLAIAPGAALIIEPGVEVRIAPGVSISSEGKLYALGKPGQPVRFVGAAPQRWEGIFGREGSEIILEQAEVRGGGAGGTVIDSIDGTLVLRGVRVTDNGGRVHSAGSRLEVKNSEISGNDMPYGAALEASFSGGSTTITSNRIGGNRMSAGAPQILIENTSGFEDLTVDIQGNMLIGQDGPNLTLTTGTTGLRGNIICNALLNGANGLSIRSETNQSPGFPLTIRENAIDDHVPPIIPIYLQYGIGRGATSEVLVDMRNNWWGSDLGPYEPDRWADGRGDSVGENIEFDPWLREWPACVPRP